MRIERGLVFTGKYFTGRIEVLFVDEYNDILRVGLQKQNGTHLSNWNEEWNLEHTKIGFVHGDYFFDEEIEMDKKYKLLTHILAVPSSHTEAVPFCKLNDNDFFYEPWSNGTAKYKKVNKSKAKCIGLTSEQSIHVLGKEEFYNPNTKCIVFPNDT